MTDSPTITYTLEEFLMRFEQKIDRQFADLKTDLKQDIAQVRQEISVVKTELKHDMAELKTELKQEISSVRTETKHDIAELKQETKELNQKVSDLAGDVKALNEKISGVENTLNGKFQGINKRLENLEFIIRAALVAFFTGFVGLILKILGVVPSIKTPLT